MKKQLGAIALLCLTSVSGSSDPLNSSTDTDIVVLPEVVVTPTRFQSARQQIAYPVSVISRQDIEDSQSTFALDALRQVPGMIIMQTGGAGRTASARIRGLSGQHNVVLIDGIELNNSGSVSTSEGNFDFGNLLTADIERIEIIRGPQSTVYGSDAIAGVINIITRKAVSDKPRFTATTSAGSFSTLNTSASLSGRHDKLSYRFNGQYFRTDGYSSAESPTGAGFERDGYEQSNAGFWLRWDGSEQFSIEGSLRYSRNEGAFDAGAGTDDIDNIDRDTVIISMIKPSANFFDGRWESQLPVSLSVTQGKIFDNFSAPLDLENIQPKIDWHNRIDVMEWLDVVAGLQWESEQAEINNFSIFAGAPDPTIRQSLENYGFYGMLDLSPLEDLKIELSARADATSDFGTEDTYRAAASYRFPSHTRIRGAIGTGFNTPTIAQLYRPFGAPANANLQPEKSFSWETGIDQEIPAINLQLGATYFDNDIKDQIAFDLGPFNFQNIARAESQGVEVFARWAPADFISMDSSYTYTDARDKSTNLRLARTPENIVNGGLTLKFIEQKLRLRLEAIYYGKRFNRGGHAAPMPSHAVINLGTSYQLTKNLKVHARVDNLFNRDYQFIQGFATAPLSGYGGVTLSF